MNQAAIRVRESVPKTVQSSWIIGLSALLIIKVFEKIVEAISYSDQITLLVSLSAFAFLYAVCTAFVLMRQRWGIGLSVVVAILDMIVVSYMGGALSTTSVVLGIGVLIGAYFVYKYVFDK